LECSRDGRNRLIFRVGRNIPAWRQGGHPERLDKATFEFLAQRVLPSIMKGRSAEEPLRVWVPACSTGEETYALLICLIERIELSQNRVEVKMLASDVSESAISQARKGSYPENISEDFIRGAVGVTIAGALLFYLVLLVITIGCGFLMDGSISFL